jgi:hypothetical protein
VQKCNICDDNGDVYVTHPSYNDSRKSPRPVLEGISWSDTHLCPSYTGRLYGRGRDGGPNSFKKLVSGMVFAAH